VVFVNQIREKIGVMFGNPETTPGGRALKFYSSVRMDIRRIATLKDGTNMVGNRTRVKVVKNKVAPPFKMTEFDIMYGKGISKEGDIIDLAIQGEIVEKMGAWFSYGDMKIGQGKENSKKYLLDNPDIYKEIIKKVKSFMGIDVDKKK
jgi:recombination protein RecA